MDRTDALVPPGMDRREKLLQCAMLLALAAMVQLLGFATSYFAAREAMYVRAYGELVEREAVFAVFAPMMRAGDYAYLCYAAVPVWLLCRNVAYLYSGGSRAIYTMRRLPKRSELIVRCAALPALCLPAAAAARCALTLCCGLVYALATPDRWLAADAWAQVFKAAF